MNEQKAVGEAPEDNTCAAPASPTITAASPGLISQAQSEPEHAAPPSKPSPAEGPGIRSRPLFWSGAFVAVAGVIVVIVKLLSLDSGIDRERNQPKNKPPHIVFILADDLGWGDLSYNGNPQIRTPNIDALAWNGVRLTRLYHQPMCTPTRSAIMTGRYPIHTGMQHFVLLMEEARGLPLELKLLPQWLNDLGYTSYIIGKWHLGFYKSAYTPTKRGFVSHVGNWGGAIDYYTHERAPKNSSDSGLDFRRNLTVARSYTGVYYTDIITQEALSVIRNHPVQEPMFLYVAHFAPHYGSEKVPFQPPPRPVEGYDFIGNKNRTMYAGMLSALDESIGLIFAALQESGILDNTFLIFCSDNGAAATFWGKNAASSWPLRGEKSTLWEGGVRVPGFIWTSKSLWNGPGSYYDRLFHATDWLPTLYEVAGGEVSKLAGIDGVSHFGSLYKPTAPAPRSEILLNIDPVDGNVGIIQDRYKLIAGRFPHGVSGWLNVPGMREAAANESELARQSCLNSQTYKVLVARGADPSCGLGDDVYSVPIDCGERKPTMKPCSPESGPCLYDIIADPCEYHDVASENPQVVQRLQQRLEDYQKGVVKPSNVPLDPEAFPSRHGGAWVTWKDDVPL